MSDILKKRIVAFIFTFIALLATSSAFADLVFLDAGLTTGEKAPEITAIDTNGERKSIDKLSGEKGLILVFFRSADWCPYCKRHLIELNEYTDKFTNLGYGVASISYDPIDILKGFTKDKKIKFSMLSDENAATFSAYGILNAQYKVGDTHYGIPYPGVVVINEQGNIIHTYFYQGFKKRVKFEKLYQKLR